MSRRTQYLLFIWFVALAVFVMVGLASSRSQDWPFADTSFRQVRNLSGPLGSFLAYSAFALLGRLFAWFLPIALIVFGTGLLMGRSVNSIKGLLKSFFIIVLLVSFFAIMPFTRDSALLTGSAGRRIAALVSSVLGQFGGSILLITCLLLVLLAELRQFGSAGVQAFGKLSRAGEALTNAAASVRGLIVRGIELIRTRRDRRRESGNEPIDWAPPPPLELTRPAATGIPEDAPWLEMRSSDRPQTRGTASVPSKRPLPTRRPAKAPAAPKEGAPLERATLPPMSILRTDAEASAGYSADQLRGWSEVLEGKLSNYGVKGSVTAVNQGPQVTTFEFEPAPGVKIKDIVSRADDLALAMRARSLRLIAPIPGRAVVGIEIPNPDQSVVYFHDVLREIPERLRYSGIMIALGVDAIGKPFHMNLCSAPHLLMAGTTGSGKSVALNGFLASILFQYRPSDVRLLIVDPKMVEMSMFNGIPHLLHPVITDPREAVRLFNYLISEMERRNELLRKNGVKNIESFNSKIALGKVDENEWNEKLPYIVLVVDELADLVLTKGIDFESLLSRLSNMARAVGIHMIVATQRPSVDIIDGKTKANFPTRIAFRVASKVDSRTILDCMGAEKLLGKGDMLYVDAKHPEALRLHGSWLAEEEIQHLVDHWKQYDFEESHLKLFEDTKDSGPAAERDSYFDDAMGVVLRYRQGSTSLLQRKLHVGYARAARILDQLELAGVVGPPDGSKPRDVLVGNEEEITRNIND
ncbi:MAG: DNA translocase FtsK [Candidatus Krumholzibacteria bacterium]|nr:DNA translocase FtsK [Candidatus Krumholzibacteria bacterium]